MTDEYGDNTLGVFAESTTTDYNHTYTLGIFTEFSITIKGILSSFGYLRLLYIQLVKVTNSINKKSEISFDVIILASEI